MLSKLNESLKQKWEKAQFVEPTTIQSKVFEWIADNKDVVAVSPTGSGKTLAYSLPLLNKLEKNGELQLLVLSPSQELAQQIGQVLREWSELRVQVISGGANLKRQLEQLKNKPEIIVATPGRLNEIATQSKKIKFHQVKTIVIDEADYLLKDEHLNSVRQIVKRLPAQTQKLFFSATSNEKLNELDKWFGITAEYVNVQNTSQTLHTYMLVDDRKQVSTLKKIVQDISRALVFVQHVGELAMLYEKLAYEGVSVATLHSDMHHVARKEAIQAFKNDEVTYLLTTDVAARGIDIDDLELVIQMGVPRERDIYTHRSGRTGRMGKSGVVMTFVNTYTLKELKKIVPTHTELTEVMLKNGKLFFK